MFRVWGTGVKVKGLGFRFQVWGLRFRVYAVSVFRGLGLGFGS